MNISGRRSSLIVTFSLLSSLNAFDVLAQDQLVGPRTWHVANNGVDESNCGRLQSPCRSISRAIENANAGDTIVVGPGRYGDLDGDGSIGGLGEESGTCGAIVCIQKSLRVISLDGAERTVIDATVVVSQGVAILANDVVFGLAHRGFTVTGAFGAAVRADSGRVQITDNIVADNRSIGFLLDDDSFDCQLTANKAVVSDQGFVVLGRNHRVESNVAQANAVTGFWLAGNGYVLRHNHALGNGDGVLVTAGDGHLIVRNAIIGNSSAGVKLTVAATNIVIRENNIFGNGTSTSGANMGLDNVSQALVRARNNFWGSDMGPGPDPADEIVTSGLSKTAFQPFATEPFSIP